jgi:hypothetical protein
MIAGTLEIQMLANLARLSQDMAQAKGIVGGAMKDIERVVGQAKAALGALGAGLSVAALATFTANTIRATAALDDMAEQTGATVEKLSALRTVASIGGHEFAGITEVIGKMIKGLKGADEEGQAAAKALEFLGVKAKDANGRFRDGVEILQDIAKGLAKYEDGGNKIALIQDAVGKGGAKYLSLLKDMAEEGELQAKVTTKQAAEAEKLEKNWNRLKISGEDWKRNLVMEVTPALNALIERMLEAQKQGRMLSQVMIESGKNVGKAGTYVPGPVGAIMRGFGSFADRMESNRRRTPLSVPPGWRLGDSIAGEGADPVPPYVPIPLNYESPKKGGAGNEDPDAGYRNLLKSLKEKLLLDRELTEVNKLQLTLDAMSEKNRATIDAQREKELKSLAAKIDLNKRLKEQRENDAKNEEALIKMREEGAQVQADDDAKRIAAYEANQKTIEQIELETKLIGQSNEAREQAIALRAMELAGIKESDPAYENEARRLREAIAARQAAQLNDDLRRKSVEANEAVRQREVQEWGNAWSMIEAGGRNVWQIMTAGGEGMAKSIGKALKTSVIDMMYQFAAKPIMLQIGAGIAGSLGMTSAANAATSALGGGMGAFNLASMGNTVSGWLGGPTIGSSLFGAGAAIEGLGGAYGTAAAIGELGGIAGAAGSVATATSAAAAGVGSLGAALAAVPGWGWAAAGALALLSMSGDEDKRKQSELVIRGGANGMLGLEPINVNGAGNIDARNPAYDQAAALLNQIPADMRAGLIGKGISTGPSDSAEAMIQALFADPVVQAAMKDGAEAAKKLAEATKAVEEADLAAAEAARALAEERTTLQIRLLKAQGDAEGALAMERDRELAATNDLNRELLRQIYAAEDLAKATAAAALAEEQATRAQEASTRAAEDAARAQAQIQAQLEANARSGVLDAVAVLRTAYEREASTLEQMAAKWSSAAESLRKYGDTLVGAGTGGVSYATAARNFSEVARRAQLGDLAAISLLQGAGEDFRKASLSGSASSIDYARDIARIRSAVFQTADLADRQESVALQERDLLKTQVSELIDVNGNLVSVKEAIDLLEKKVAEMTKTTKDAADDTRDTKEVIEAVTRGQLAFATTAA